MASTSTQSEEVESNVNMVPGVLRNKQRWLCYRIEQDSNGNETKVPKAPRWTVDGDTVYNIGTNSADEWVTYEEATAFVQKTQQKLDESEALDGVGFVFVEDGPFVGIDMDHVIDPDTGEYVVPEAQDVLNELDSFSEISTSGDGLHVIVHAPDGLDDDYQNRKDWLEMYDSGRFFVTTGDHVSGTPYKPQHRPDTLREVQRDYLPEVQSTRSDGLSSLADARQQYSAPDAGLDATPEQVAKTAMQYDDDFERLFDGHDMHRSTSESDFSFFRKLYFWCKGDTAMMEQVAMESDRVRDKWFEDRNGQRFITYDITRAARKGGDTYSGSY